MRATALLPHRPSLSKTPRPRFTSASRHRRVPDEMPMDDATASDNCGEVTIEVSSETIKRRSGQLRDRSYVRPPTMRATLQPRRPSLSKTPRLLSSLRPADVECSDEMPMDDATASDNCGEVTMKCLAKRRWRRSGHDRSHVHGHRRCGQQRFSLADHHCPRHHGPVHLRPCRLHRRVLG